VLLTEVELECGRTVDLAEVSDAQVAGEFGDIRVGFFVHESKSSAALGIGAGVRVEVSRELTS
jgi:hypothetical protein